MNDYQQTLAKATVLTGTGIHSGKKFTIEIHPAPPNHGIMFRRTDLPGTGSITALFSKIVDTSLATVIGQDGFIISTVEHLLATFTGMQIDNARVDVSGHEIPIMDGSALPFVTAFQKTGVVAQKVPRHYLKVLQPIELEENGKRVGLYPYDGFRVSCEIDFPQDSIGRQKVVFTLEDHQFETNIAGARTFGFYEDAIKLQQLGLASGGALNHCIIIKDNAVMNPEGLRWPDEFVRHKALDCIGDFSLLGLPVLGSFVAVRSGHSFNHAFLQKFLASKAHWKTVTLA